MSEPEGTRYPMAARLIIISLGSFVFLAVVPAAIIVSGSFCDSIFKVSQLITGPWRYFPGGVLLVVGVAYMGRSVLVLSTLGRGTPAPIMPPQRLIISGPYGECRNPMALGNLLYFIGIAFIFGSSCSMVIALVLSCCILAYYRFIEERELAKRFGSEYEQYRARIPFVFPRLGSKKH